MSQKVLHRMANREGHLEVILDKTAEGEVVFLKSGQSIHLEDSLIGRSPLEAIQLTQRLSTKSGVAHGIAATLALENYLQIEPARTGQLVRHIQLYLSTIHSHIHHFYWEVLPDYLNLAHETSEFKKYYMGLKLGRARRGDLSRKKGRKILAHLPQAYRTLGILQEALAELGGKFPVVMNLIPGGVTNFSLDRKLIMRLLRSLEQSKAFIELVWPTDVKEFIQAVPNSTKTFDEGMYLISFGSLLLKKGENQQQFYSTGVLMEEKKDSLNELKITESLYHTYYRLISRLEEDDDNFYDPKRKEAYTWIKGARYESEPMFTGALARMLVTHVMGGNLDISDNMQRMIEDLQLPPDAPNCLASRLLAEVLETRFFMREVMEHLQSLDPMKDRNLKRSFDFQLQGSGTGKVEAPGGSLLHEVWIKDGLITQYRIVSPANWNFSTTDSSGKTGIVERELNRLHQAGKLTSRECSKVLNSYYIQVLDGTQ
ncbi:MAG: hypothetical protein COB67_12900 [SAR324 cluster bacterium]|uniref:Uncharacterized protein n=1 Tax=SAR324 cluster bacterium TaxID=2024889 RepID=A0A2A4SQL7_9DELT|nr:MAG: hypothetical protein COB67_12900 [SAR324 cluster bacterium]